MPVTAESLLLDYSFDQETSLTASKLLLPNLTASLDSIYSTSSSVINTPNLPPLQHSQYSSQYSHCELESSLAPVKTEADDYYGPTLPSNASQSLMDSPTPRPSSCSFIPGAPVTQPFLSGKHHLVIKSEMNLSDTNSDDTASYYPAADMQTSPAQQYLIDDLLSVNLPEEPGMELLLEAACCERKQPVTANKSNRFRATPSELHLLLSIFERNAFPSRILRQKLAEHLRLSVRQVQLWFQNRRASLKSNGSVFKRDVKMSV
ncbi:hypothetical protein HDU81_002309 [Chytriomyces hyalinus]|nr:hypothetical protein HDU81_002309 [Chytriomyces hyalinus]